MDQPKAEVGASETVANASSHHRESKPMSSHHGETKPCADHLEHDAHVDRQYVFIEHDSSSVCSSNVSSEWSARVLDKDLVTLYKETPPLLSNAASQDSSEEHGATSQRDDTSLPSLSTDSRSDFSRDSSEIYIPSNCSTGSDNPRLLSDCNMDNTRGPGCDDRFTVSPTRPEDSASYFAERSAGSTSFHPVQNVFTPMRNQVSSILMIPASSIKTKARRLTRHCQICPATMFDYMQLSPEEHFPAQTMHRGMPHPPRYVNRWKNQEVMLVTNGSCAFPDAAEGPAKAPKCESSAGASFIYKPSPSDAKVPSPTTMPFQAINQAQRIDGVGHLPVPDSAHKIGLRLEAQGPGGDVQEQTSNRAKLRAVIAALEFRPWHVEGWQRVVVVTDLEYIALGATRWISVWAKRRWRSAPIWNDDGTMRLGKKIVNRDLWEALQSRVDTLREYGTEVSFWLVPASMNSPLLREAKAAAHEAARSKPDMVVVEEFTKLVGIGM